MKKIFALLAIFTLIPVFAFSQEGVNIDKGLENSMIYLNRRIPAGTKVVVLNFNSEWPKLTDYIIEELTGYIVNTGSLTVVDRANLETIRQEMNFQLSGEVSDASAQAIGQKLGAQTIISGSIVAMGNLYRLRVRAISVETAHILGIINTDVIQDRRIAALTVTTYAAVNRPAAPPAAPPAAAVQQPAAPPPAPTTASYSVNLNALPLKRNDKPFANQWDDFFIPFPQFQVDVTKYQRITVKVKYFNANGREIEQSDGMAMLSLIYDPKGDWRGPEMGPGPNTPVKEFNLGGYSGQIHTNKGVRMNLTRAPGGILFQNSNANVRFIEVTEITFHN
ncbi:MAG: CsgG/HfaB family protein [Treponema sp.]|jgi:TolB-like protein|nr:CsgG/HfaB family protein [Treponema sp.]